MNAVRTTALAAVHNQPVGRRYTVAEVKQIVYPLIEVIDNALLLEHKPGAGKRDIISALKGTDR